jgi:hypothetical protein
MEISSLIGHNGFVLVLLSTAVRAFLSPRAAETDVYVVVVSPRAYIFKWLAKNMMLGLVKL